MTTPYRPQPLRGRPAAKPAPRAGSAVVGVMGQFSKRFGAGFSDIAARWPEIVGDKTARLCTPVKITGSGAGGTLHVAAVGPSTLLVEAAKDDILVRINSYCGRDVARRLAITRAAAQPAAERPSRQPRPAGVSPLAKLRLEAQLADIDDPRLKAALMKLGRAVEGARPGSEGARPPRERE